MSAISELHRALKEHNASAIVLTSNKAVESIGCFNITIKDNKDVIDSLLAIGYRFTDPVSQHSRILEKDNVVVQVLKT